MSVCKPVLKPGQRSGVARAIAGIVIVGVAIACAVAAIAQAPQTFGSFTVTVPDGWTRASADDEKEAGGWMFGFTKGLAPDATPVIVTFLRDSVTYSGEDERVKILKRLRDNLQAEHQSSFKADRIKLAGVDTDRFQIGDGEQTLYYLYPYNGERIFTIVVIVPRPNAQFPPEAQVLLSTVRLLGRPYQPPRRPGFLDRLTGNLEKLQQRLDELAGVLGGEKKTETPTETKPTETGQAGKTEQQTQKTDARTGASQTTASDTVKVQNPPVAVRPAETASEVSVRLDASGNRVAQGLAANDRVWAPATTKAPAPLEAETLKAPNLLDLSLLSQTQYAGGAAIALAAMRELAGLLKPEEEARLNAKWAPYLQMPPEGADEYFNKLAPILQETLALRTMVATAAAEFDAAWEEAVAAAEWENENGVREALAIADQQRRFLVAAQSRLAELAHQAESLGSPPDPIRARAEAQKEHAEAIKTARSLIPQPKLPGAWVLKRVIRNEKRPPATYPSIYAAGDYDGVNTTMTDTHVLVEAHMANAGEHEREPGKWLVDIEWAPLPALIAAGSRTDLVFTWRAGYAGLDRIVKYVVPLIVGTDWPDGFLLADPKERPDISFVDDIPGRTIMPGKILLLGGAPNEDLRRGEFKTGRTTVSFRSPDGQPGKTIRLYIGRALNWDVNQHLLYDNHPELVCFYERVFEYVWTTDPAEIANAGKDIAEEPASEEEKAKNEAIAFHEANVLIIQRNLQKDREELASETDPNRRAMLEFRIMQKESDLIAEQDLIASLQTGEIVHRRTPFDDYARDRFIQSIRENQVAMERFQRATDALQRLAAMLPAGEAEEARMFIDRQLSKGALAKMDMSVVQRIARALNEKVQGYVERERAQANLDEAWAQANLETAERIKWAADNGMFVCSIFGGRGVMMAYQAATGYIEGGPTEAILRSAAWCGTPGYVASEAFRGYYRVDEQGNPRGWLGAAKDAATAFILGKAFEYGAGKAQQWAKGSTPGAMTVAEHRQLEQFRRLRAQGEQQAREFVRAQAELERAAFQGASPETIARLQAQCRSAAVAVHANPHAKNYLKFRGDIHSQRAYNAHMRATHAEVEARFHELMEQRGWNRQPLREFRNASSGNSVGMDHDIGLDEAAASALLHNGRPASLYRWQEDAQRAWNEAYAQVTGQSAARSWETVTTSAHAEAYRDLEWLSGDASRIQRAWGQQAADVTRYKNWHLLNDPALDRFTALQEASRGTAKDIGSKLQPLFDAARPATPQAAEALARSRRHWTKIQTILDAYGNNTLDPVSASRRIREVTGGKDIPEVLEEAAMVIESLSKHVGQ